MVAAIRLANERPFRADEWSAFLFDLALFGAPLGLLALLRVRDWLAWLVATLLIASVCGWIIYGLIMDEGTNILLGFVYPIVSFFISFAALIVAGIRGNLVWARDGDEPAQTGGEGL